MRRIFVLIGVTLAGCQCFQPVGEEPLDAGVLDGGSADAGPECVTAATCGPTGVSIPCPFGAQPAQRSCLDGRCVYDCGGPRTCTSRTGSGDLSCGTDAGCTQRCGDLNGVAMRVYRSCGSAFVELGKLRGRYRQGATCDFEFFTEDGGAWGGLHSTCDEGSNATVIDEPGVTCSARELATALNRIELGCARCVYLLEWP